MKEFGQEEKSILDTILASNMPWVMVRSLPANGIFLANLILEGMVELWSTDRYNRSLIDGPFVTLTPLGCEVLHVTLVERNEVLPANVTHQSGDNTNPFDGWFPRWDPVDGETGWGIHDSQPIHLFDRPWLRRIPLPESLTDTHPEPSLLMDEDKKPIRFFTGPSNGNGYTATIDPRLIRKKRTRHR